MQIPCGILYSTSTSASVEIPVHQPSGIDKASAGDRVAGHLGPLDAKSGIHMKDLAERRGDADPAIWECVESREADIIPSLCKLLICGEQVLLIGQRIPLEDEFAGRLEPLQYTDDGLTV